MVLTVFLSEGNDSLNAPSPYCWQPQSLPCSNYLDIKNEQLTRNYIQEVMSLLAADRQRYSSVGYPCIFASTTSSPYSLSMATCNIATKQIHAMPTPKRCLSPSRLRSKRSCEYKFDGPLGHCIGFRNCFCSGRFHTLVSAAFQCLS